jgi:putative ABC transport system substrate-binding protein
VPIVFTGISEPVERGFVASLARPGGNATGFTNLEATMGGKLSLLNIRVDLGIRLAVKIASDDCLSAA